MPEGILDKSQLLSSLPAIQKNQSDELIKTALKNFHQKIVVLDDDPTGTQTVHDISVYTSWDIKTFKQAFAEPNNMFYILTNSRSLTAMETASLHKEIATNLATVAKETNIPFIVISRSDSTLRGHYPLETETLRDTIQAQMGIHYDGEIIMPFFIEGGRYTINDTHYVANEDKLIPAAQTEFAKDRSFGYKHSNLRDWIAEKTNNAFPANSITSLTIGEERSGNIASLTNKLLIVSNFNKVIVNAADYSDVKVATAAIISALNQGKHFMFRTAAAFTKVISGLPDIPLLKREDITETNNKVGGLIVVGSHVQKTTDQLNELLTLPNVTGIAFNTSLVTDPEKMDAEFQRVLKLVQSTLQSGKNVVVYTSRKQLELGPGRQDEELKLSVKISDYVTKIVRSLTFKPSFIIAKGGITSSDVATKGLGIKKATVAGQALPGIPVWITGPESKFPNIAYVVFPGNVGGKDALKKVVSQLSS